MVHIPTASYPICPFCQEHIELETANTDDKGRAVHEECYVSHLISAQSDVSASNAVVAALLQLDRRKEPRFSRQS